MNPGLVVKLRPSGPWRIGPDSGARNRVDVIYHSDSLFSAVTSAMSRMGRLEDWLNATARSATPAVCLSSCFPFIEETGFVVPPRTVWPPLSSSLKAAPVRWKSARFIPLDMVQSILAGERLDENRWSVDGPSGCLLPAGKQGPFRTSVRWGAAIDRLSGASERHATACIEFRAGAGLWAVVGFAGEAARDEWQESVKAAFRLLADTGFGGERSRGWGRSETPEFIEGDLPGMIIGEPRAAAPEPEIAEAHVTASPAIEPLQAEPAVEENQPSDTQSPAEDQSPVPPMQEPPDEPSPVPPAEPPQEEPPVQDPEPEPGQTDPPGEDPTPPLEEPGQPAPVPVPDSSIQADAVEQAAELDAPPAEAAAAPAVALEPEPGQTDPPGENPTPPLEEPGQPAPVPVPDSAIQADAVEQAAEADAPPAEAAAAPAVAMEPEPETATPPVEAREPEPVAVKDRRSGHAHWMLSLFTPAAADTVDWGRGSYTLMSRGGRVDSPAGSGELKKQIQMIAEGSVLVAESAPLGAAPDVAPDGFAHPVFRAGFALAIPLPEVH